MMAAADYGVDIDCVTDCSPTFATASGFKNLGNAIARRLLTPKGTLSYDPSYGFGLRRMLNASFTPGFISRAQDLITRECERDLRVRRAQAQVVYSYQTQTLNVTVRITTQDGPFTLVLSVNSLTVPTLKVTA